MGILAGKDNLLQISHQWKRVGIFLPPDPALNEKTLLN
jgi:hypothetical protein